MYKARYAADPEAERARSRERNAELETKTPVTWGEIAIYTLLILPPIVVLVLSVVTFA